MIEWRFYDRHAPAIESRRNLPHIDMNGALTFITFRLADSMPKSVVKRWQDEIDAWLLEHDLFGKTVEHVLTDEAVEASLKTELRQFKNRRWHGHLDDCHGSCLLKLAKVRALIESSLLKFNSQRYDLERFVIMPNHVHLLIQMREGYQLRKQLTDTLRYSARQVNKLLERRGEFWQSEPFDHIVRSEAQFSYLQRYIDENPAKARIPDSEFTIWTA